MKRYSRLLSLEQLEEKRLKAGDLAQALAHAPAFEVAEVSSAKTSLAAEESADDETDNETDDTDDDTDETDDTDSDDDDDNDSEESDNNDDESGETELKAPLTTGGADAGSAKVENDADGNTDQTDFKVSVTGAPPGNYTVTVGNTLLSGVTLTVDAQGNGELKLASEPDSDEQALPSNFPAVTAGTTITLTSGATTITGTFANDSDNSDSLQSVTASDTQNLAAASFFDSQSGSVVMDHSSTSTVATQRLQAQNRANDAADLNVLDTGFASAENSLDSWKDAEFQPNREFLGDDVAATAIDEALFQALVDGELAWIA